MKKFFICGILVCCVAFLAGCGYSTRSLALGNRRTIHVKPFKNKIAYTSDKTRTEYFPLLEVNIREAIIDRYLFDGNLRIAKEDTAHLILSGELLGYDRGALRYTDDDDVEEYRIHLTVSLKMWDETTQKMLWEESNFVGETTYFTSGASGKTESAAIEDAIVDLARRIVERTVEDW